MKDNLFEMLLSLFEKTITKLKEAQLAQHEKNNLEKEPLAMNVTEVDWSHESIDMEQIKPAGQDSMRILTNEEKMKLTKASYQFITRMHMWGVLSREEMEDVLNQVSFSDSRFVGLEETKTMIRDTLVDELNTEQQAFLDLILYQQEEHFTLH